MKKTFKFFAAALAIVAAASCAKEISNDAIQAPEQELVHKVFTASLNVDPETKTTLHTDGVSVHWTEDDVIKVIPADSEYGNNFNVMSCNGTFADFEGETVDANSYRAVYPASAYMNGSIGVVYSYKNYFIFASKDSKCALAHQYAVENDFSVIKEFNASSNFAISTSSQDDNLYFKNINAYLKLSLAMDDAASIEVSASKINSAPYNDDGTQSYSTDAKLGGPIAYHLSKNKKGIVPNNGENIIFSKEDGSNLLSGDDIHYYIAIPSVGMYDLQLVVRDANGKVLQKLVKSGKFTPAANNIYDLGLIEPMPPAKVGDYVYSDGSYSTNLNTSKEVVGVVFYAGNPKDRFNDPDLPGKYGNGLAVSIKTYSTLWNNSKPSVSNTLLKVSFSNLGSHDTCGYTIKNLWNSEGISLNVYNYNYGTLSENTSGWYLGTLKEWTCIFENITAVNNTLANVSGSVSVDPTSTYPYVLPLYSGTANFQVYRKSNGSTGYQSCSYNITSYQQTVRPIFAF